jgi:hypothetical protein
MGNIAISISKDFREKSPPISFIVGTKDNKLDSVVKAVRTICTENNGIIPLLSASCAVKENNQKIAFDGTTVETTKVSFERFTQRHRAFANHIHLFSDGFFDCTVLF